MNIYLRHAVIPLLASLTLGALSTVGKAQDGPCIRVDRIAKWEILDRWQALAYDSSGNSIAFINFDASSAPDLRQGAPSFRFFSPSICRSDNVQINGKVMSRISYIEPVRKQ
jgi:hypothetical protein